MKNETDSPTLLDKLKPYVDSALPAPVKEEIDDYDNAVSGVEATPADLRKAKLERVSRMIYGAWSEVLRWAYDDNNHLPVQLNKNLLPPIVKEDQVYWDDAVRQSGLSNDQIENILQKFGENELLEGYKLELSWGGYIVRNDSGYELRST